MAGLKYHRFPYRSFFRWFFLLFFLALMPCAPLFVYFVGLDIERWNEEGLNQSPSYRHEPGLAEAETWDWHSYWPVAFWSALVLFLAYLYVFWWSRPGNDPKHSSYD